MVGAGLGRREVEAAEGAVLGVGQRLDRAVGAQPGQGQALGVDQLDVLAHQLLRQVEGHGGAGLVEAGHRDQRSTREQLEIGQLPRRGAVLGGRHRIILPVSEERPIGRRPSGKP